MLETNCLVLRWGLLGRLIFKIIGVSSLYKLLWLLSILDQVLLHVLDFFCLGLLGLILTLFIGSISSFFADSIRFLLLLPFRWVILLLNFYQLHLLNLVHKVISRIFALLISFLLPEIGPLSTNFLFLRRWIDFVLINACSVIHLRTSGSLHHIFCLLLIHVNFNIELHPINNRLQIWVLSVGATIICLMHFPFIWALDLLDLLERHIFV